MHKELSPERLMYSREIFNYFDTKGDEKVSVGQVGDVLRSLGLTPTETEIRKHVEGYQPESRLTFEAFLPIYQSMHKLSAEPNVDALIDGLASFDREGNGQIMVAELRHVLTNVGERLSDEEADVILQGIDDVHGMVNIGEFVRKIVPKSDDY